MDVTENVIVAAGKALRLALREHFFDRDFELGKYSAENIAKRVIEVANDEKEHGTSA